METTDVMVVGGGPAGAAAALTLAQSGRRCVLVEKQAAPRWKIGETLAPESRQILLALDVWAAFEQQGHLPSPGNISSWGHGGSFAKDFIFNPHGSAWQLDRVKFESLLLDAAAAAGAQIRPGADVREIRRLESGWEIVTTCGTWTSPWLVDATGRASILVRRLGHERLVSDKLVAVFATGPNRPEAGADARTYIEARPEGWWYSALMPNHRRIFAFLTDADLLPGQDWRSAAWFRQKITETQHLRALLSPNEILAEVAPKLTSSQTGRLETCHGAGWLAVGDAAQSLDPLSGEGLFQALFTGHEAGKALVRQWSGEAQAVTEYGELVAALWRRYWQNRRRAYASETRWPNEPFWRRRRETAAAVA